MAAASSTFYVLKHKIHVKAELIKFVCLFVKDIKKYDSYRKYGEEWEKAIRRKRGIYAWRVKADGEEYYLTELTDKKILWTFYGPMMEKMNLEIELEKKIPRKIEVRVILKDIREKYAVLYKEAGEWKKRTWIRSDEYDILQAYLRR